MMDGETHPQPGNRPPAPGGLALVQRFLNTHYDLAGHRQELLDTPAALRRWMAERRLVARDAAIGEAELLRIIHVREGLRHLAIANNGGRPDGDALRALEDASRGALVVVGVAAGPTFAAAGNDVPAAVGVLLAAAARAMLDGTWPRMKACPGEHCGWVFYDASRNLSGRWCAMSVCGDRAKARAYYRRRTPP
jgi:predicted RNA-binding Zn ribbon-like protein